MGLHQAVINATPCQFTTIGIGSFCDKKEVPESFPRLKGSGAETKDLLGSVRDAYMEFGSAESPYYDHVAQALADLEDIQTVLHDHAKDLLLPTRASDELINRADNFLLGYQKLAAMAESEHGDMLFSMPTKFHMLHHLARKSRFLNPRRTNCFIDEDFVGKVKVLVHSCSSGTEMHRMSARMMEKYRRALNFLALDVASPK